MVIWVVVLLAGLVSGPRIPSFDRLLVLDAAKEPAANAGIGDLNGDGFLDLVLVKGRHWPGKSRVFSVTDAATSVRPTT